MGLASATLAMPLSMAADTTLSGVGLTLSRIAIRTTGVRQVLKTLAKVKKTAVRRDRGKKGRESGKWIGGHRFDTLK